MIDTATTDSPADTQQANEQPQMPEGISPENKHQLFTLYNELCRRQAVEADIAEQHKAAKKATETAQNELNQFIGELRTGQRVLFTDESQGENWRDCDIALLSEHGLKDGKVAKLKDAGIQTIGALADLTASGKPLWDIDGIGTASADEIEAAFAKFWAAHPEWCEKPSAAGDETDEDDND